MGWVHCSCTCLQGLKRQELRDELYMQLVKQTRSNPNSSSKAQAWGLFHLVASAMPPSKEFTGLISEYVHTALQVRDVNTGMAALQQKDIQRRACGQSCAAAAAARTR